MKHVAVLGPGRIGRQIALAFALGGSRVSLVDVKTRPAGGAAAVFADARREVRRDLTLMTEEGVIQRPFDPALFSLYGATIGLYRTLTDADAGFRLADEPAGMLLVSQKAEVVRRLAEALRAAMPELRPEDGLFAREYDKYRWYRCLRCDSWIPLPPPVEPAREHPPQRSEILFTVPDVSERDTHRAARTRPHRVISPRR